MKKYILLLLIVALCFTTGKGQDRIYIGTGQQSSRNILPHYHLYIENRSINISGLVPGEHAMIFDSAGRNVFKKTVQTDYLSVKVRDRGMYIIRIQRSNNVFTERVLVY